ncbi:MAG: hypothetical protein IJL08_03345 [Oscillospiraceae bacterium]|jgi:phage FluMu protein Com|nr:hypothetical protein [Oscillospiraceae bacterium]MBQ7737392.1 hypothetical protein [Oscillospiraceae bacterium]
MQRIIEWRTPAGSELKQKLAKSRSAVQHRQPRTIRCPSCGFYLLDIYGREHCYIRVKCRKCKFDETIDTALFRTVKGRKSGPARFPGRREKRNE